MPTSDFIVGQATERLHELDTLITSADGDDERAYLTVEAKGDPYFGPALEVKQLLGDMATGLSNLAASRIQELQARRDEQTSGDDEFDRIADLDGYDEQRESADKKAATIQTTHSFIENARGAEGFLANSRTVKQQKAVKRTVSRAYRESWETAALANDPEQLRTVLESLDASSLPENRKQELSEFITREVKSYVSETAGTTDPDTIARRLLAALEPSAVSDGLVDTLLKPYFVAAEVQGVDEVLDNFETFLRGVLRIADYPRTMATALEIASFKTKILTEDSLYFYHFKVEPTVRLDRPELFGRLNGISRAMSSLQAHVDGVTTLLNLQSITEQDAPPSVYSSLTEQLRHYSEDLTPDELVKEYRDIMRSTRFATLQTETGRLVSTILGLDEFKRRAEAMDAYFRVQSTGIVESTVPVMIETSDGNNGITAEHALDIFIRKVIEEFPDQAEFLHTLAHTGSRIQDELPDFITDASANLLTMWQTSNGIEFAAHILDQIGTIDGKDKPSIEEMDEFGKNAQTTTIELGDGYVVELIESKGLPYPTPSEIASLLEEIGTDRIRQAQQQIEGATGARRRHELIMGPGMSSPVLIRRENKQDKKAIHPINPLVEIIAEMELADPDTLDEISLLTAIEENRMRINDKRRRFLNQRGIRFDLFSDEDEQFQMTVKKHPDNRKAFVVEFLLRSGEERQTARILMDDKLQFRLGEQRVRNRSALLLLNMVASELVAHFACQEAVETTEGRIEGNKGLVERIAHLRLLPEGQQRSDDRWYRCLELEGLDLDVLGKLQQEKLGTNRVTTYVEAVESDGEDKGPIVITDLFDE